MATLSLCMIVRNESEVLARCLESVAGVADETVVVDTGSTDDTIAIARSFGARVETFAWIDDFAAARNRSFELASCPYLLWLDADDVVPPAEREKLLALKPRLDKDVYFLRYEYHTDELGNCTCSLHRERIVRKTSEIRWLFPVHEVISCGPAATREVVDIVILHRPTRGGLERDRGRDLQMLERAQDRPEYLGNPLFFYLLAVEHRRASRPRDAIAGFERFLASPGDLDEHRIRAWLQIAVCHHQLSHDEPALACEHRRRAATAALECRRLGPGWAEPCFLLGLLAEAEDDTEGAVSWYEQALLPFPQTLSPIAPHAYTVGPAARLCAIWQRLGDLAKASYYNELALGWNPRDPLLLLTRHQLRARS